MLSTSDVLEGTNSKLTMFFVLFFQLFTHPKICLWFFTFFFIVDHIRLSSISAFVKKKKYHKPPHQRNACSFPWLLHNKFNNGSKERTGREEDETDRWWEVCAESDGREDKRHCAVLSPGPSVCVCDRDVLDSVKTSPGDDRQTDKNKRQDLTGEFFSLLPVTTVFSSCSGSQQDVNGLYSAGEADANLQL